MKAAPRQYGLQFEKILIGDHWIFGSDLKIGGAPIQPDGNWTAYLPDPESQLDPAGFDPIACTAFGTLNAVEILDKRLYGQNRNFSDRFLAKVSGNTQAGNSPHKVAETLRKGGTPNETDWPFPPTIRTWAEFYADIPQATQTLAQAFIDEFAFAHEWVVPQPQYLKQALQFSPVCVSVCAWYQDNDGYYYKPRGMIDTHWCTIVAYKDNDYWLVFDSYDPTNLKRVRWNTEFQMAKRYSLTRQIVNESSWLTFLISLIKSAYGILGRRVVTVH
jgi:hypothetical protein